MGKMFGLVTIQIRLLARFFLDCFQNVPKSSSPTLLGTEKKMPADKMINKIYSLKLRAVIGKFWNYIKEICSMKHKNLQNSTYRNPRKNIPLVEVLPSKGTIILGQPVNVMILQSFDNFKINNVSNDRKSRYK